MKQRTPRSRAYLAWLRLRNCAVCGSTGPSEAAHVRRGNGGGVALKPSDFRAVPLCHGCHADQHRVGEPEFWAEARKDPDLIALRMVGRFCFERGHAKAALVALEAFLMLEAAP